MADLSPLLRGLSGATILGINPPVHDFTFSDLWAKPLGLLFLLDYLRRRGNRVHMVDCVYEGRYGLLPFGRNRIRRTEIPKPPPFRSIPRRYNRFGMDRNGFIASLRALPPPDYILVTSVMTYWYEGVFQTVETLRECFPSSRIILGGIYARLCPEHAARSGADYIQTLPLALDLIMPAMDLYPDRRYGALLTSFGCPLACEYCASSILEPHFRRRPHEYVLEDAAAQILKGDVQDLAFFDDALLMGKEAHFYPLCRALGKMKPGIRFHTPNGLHVREIDEECALFLKESGFQTIRLSLESVDPGFQKRGSEKTGDEEYLRALLFLMQAGFPPGRLETYVLAGVPGQDPESVEKTIRFIAENGGNARLAEFSPVPGTVSFELAANLVPGLRDEPLLGNKTVFSSYISGLLAPDRLQHFKDLARSSAAR